MMILKLIGIRNAKFSDLENRQKEILKQKKFLNEGVKRWKKYHSFFKDRFQSECALLDEELRMIQSELAIRSLMSLIQDDENEIQTRNEGGNDNLCTQS